MKIDEFYSELSREQQTDVTGEKKKMSVKKWNNTVIAMDNIVEAVISGCRHWFDG
ncbi:hypothetical protein ACLJJ6_10430 [Pediococcus siamensis]|uniref:hypothetical protein n=1 Tax=Pediococcus siamensis TaxID=381829 RepID=UPI0039A2609D